jgi:outer membrane protein assembly factor BamB
VPPGGTALVLLAAAWGCVGVPPATRLDERLDFPDLRVVRPHWRMLVVDPERRAYRPLERSGAAFDPRHGLVFVGTSQGRFYALESGSGRIVWTVDEGDGFESVPVVLGDPDLVVVGNDAGRLLALVPETGWEAWRADLGGPIRAPVVFVEGVLYVRTTAQQVFAFEAASGRELWMFERPLPEGYTSGCEPGLLFAGGRIVTGFVDGTVVGLKTATGEPDEWTVNLASEEDVAQMPLDDVCTTPVAVGDAVAVASYDNGLFALDAGSGAQVWQRPDLKHVSGLAAIETDVLVAVAGVGLARVDTLDGADVWVRRFPAGTLSAPVVRRGLIVLTDDVNGLLFFDALTGVLLGTEWVGTGVAAPPAVLDGRLALLDNTGEFLTYFLAGADGRPR